MPLVTFYFQLHQPLRLHPDGEGSLLWVEQNQRIFQRIARQCYLPALELFTDILKKHPWFKLCLGLSGTFLEQAERDQPEVLEALRGLLAQGRDTGQVELLQETYYHSLVSLFADPEKTEFKAQVALHRQKLCQLFDVTCTGFRNTELIYNNDIARVVAEMGYRVVLCEKRPDMFTGTEHGPVSPHAVFHARSDGTDRPPLVVLPRHRELSDDVAFRFSRHLSPERYAQHIAQIDGEAILLGYDFEHIGEHIPADRGIFAFWEQLPPALAVHSNVVLANPSEIAERFAPADCPLIDIDSRSTSSWADVERNTFGWLGSHTQHALFTRLQALEIEARAADENQLRRFRLLTTSDHLCYLHEGKGADRLVHDYFNPYGSPVAAAYVLTHALDRLSYEVVSFNIIKRAAEQTPIILIAPESARLPSKGMGDFARYVSGKSGGLGEVVSALCQGLTDRDIPVHLITINLARRFREEAGLTEEQWSRKRREVESDSVHLVSSAIFEDYHSAYQGDPLANAAEFQRQIVNHLIKEIQSRYQGRGLIHSNDWMAGGIVSAYANLRQIPVLHTIHNTHTGHIPLEYFYGVNLGKLHDRLYLSIEHGRQCIDAQATAIKNASAISLVGYHFLREIVDDYFCEHHFIPPGVRQEIKVKAHHLRAKVIPNGISPVLYPEAQPQDPDPARPGLAQRYGPRDNLVEAKRHNLVKLQRRLRLRQDPEAILLFWPSRLDPTQKGVTLLEEVALPFAQAHPDVQIVVVGDGVGGDRTHVDIIGRLAVASQGQIAYHHFEEDLSLLGYAAAADVFGASLYEPFGQIDVMGNLYGATATNRDTGGYRDKITALSLRQWGAPVDTGNGVLFHDYDAGGLWWGLSTTVENHRRFRRNLELYNRQMRRIMEEAREKWSLENMVAGYITAYEELLGKKSLS